jgi:S-adenosylmethionine-diacylgycerolhomoserine-N-methlytransferase
VTFSNLSATKRKYRYVRHVFDLTRKYFLFGRERAIAALHLEQVDSALEIGCGTGRNLRIMGRLNPRVQLIGLDISTEMLKSARASIARAGMADRTTLVHGDATHLPDGLATPRMLMSYSLSMVRNWRCALASAIDRLQSGGILSIVDFGDFNGFPLWLARHCIETLSLHDAPPCIELSHELERHASSGHIALTHGYAMAGFYQFATVTKLTDQPPQPRQP